jgi:hypothetical protein
MDRLLKLRDNIPMHKDEQLQLYLQQFRDIDFKNRHTVILEDGLCI